MKKILILIPLLFTLSACEMMSMNDKNIAADRIARPAFMVERFIETKMFDLQAWERMHQRGGDAVIYIEGDGQHWENNKDQAYKIFDEGPTPGNPVALHLASRDLSKNVAYLARPCQYIYKPESKGCSSYYWGTRRYSREVIKAYNEALDQIKGLYGIKNFHVVGFDGGAVIASYLAAERNDVNTLRTVAGNLNHPYVTAEKGMDPLTGSLNVLDIASQLKDVPQIHFIGGADEMITPGVYHSYRQAMGQSSCVHYSLIQDASHYLGWVEKWPDLLKISPSCRYGDPAEFNASAHRAMHNKGIAKSHRHKEFK